MTQHRPVRRTSLLGGLTAALLGAAVVAPPPASAAGEATCTPVGGGALTMYVNHPTFAELLELGLNGAGATVSVNGSPVGSCVLNGATEVRVSSASGFGAWRVSDASTFLNDLGQPSHFRFGTNDPVAVYHDEPTTAADWHSVGGTGIDLNDDGVAEITAETDYLWLLLVGSDHDDTIDLANNGTGTFQGSFATIQGRGGDDTLVGGAHGDTIEGGTGNDVLLGWDGADSLAPGEDADTVYGRSLAVGGGDTDDGAQDTFTVDYDGAEDTVRGDGDDSLQALSGLGVQVSNGGSKDDGANFEGDTYTGMSDVLTGPGSDVVETTGVGTLFTGEGNDTVVVGTSPNGLMAIAEGGFDTLDLSQQTGPTSGELRATGSGAFVVPSFPQNLAYQFESFVGGSGVDTWAIGCECRAEPRGGADEITFTDDGGGTFVAGPSTDGADTVVADDVNATADYTQRTTPLSLTLDAEADDGATGEGDQLDGITTILGGSAADTIVGDSRANVLDGMGGNDSLSGRGGDDTLRGDLGSDRLSGGSGADRLLGSVGGDTLLGGDGDDLLRGDAPTDPVGGKDSLDGGAGDDDELGYSGDDTFLQGSSANGQDLLVGGLGTDLASYAARSGAVRLSLNGAYDDGASGEGDRVNGDVENLTGGRGADTITGNDLVNLLTGGAGRDRLSGLGGADTFQSLDGLVDTLLGGTGTDRAHRDNGDTVNSVEQRF